MNHMPPPPLADANSLETGPSRPIVDLRGRTGRLVHLRPLLADDAAALFATITSEEVWAWKPDPRPRNVAEMADLMTRVLIGSSSARHPFVVVRLRDGAALGTTTLYDVDMRHGRAEIGWTWLRRDCWGQGYNEDMKWLLLEYCFTSLHLERVQASADRKNVRSQRALERLGFVREGTLRSHRLRVDGTRADTVIFSVLRDEWPALVPRMQNLIDLRSVTAS
jgi:RimJ/RimL family protein N-acetyltransferase